MESRAVFFFVAQLTWSAVLCYGNENNAKWDRSKTGANTKNPLKMSIHQKNLVDSL